MGRHSRCNDLIDRRFRSPSARDVEQALNAIVHADSLIVELNVVESDIAADLLINGQISILGVESGREVRRLRSVGDDGASWKKLMKGGGQFDEPILSNAIVEGRSVFPIDVHTVKEVGDCETCEFGGTVDWVNTSRCWRLGGSKSRDKQFHIIVGEVLLKSSLDLSIGGSITVRAHVAANVRPHSNCINSTAGIRPEGQSNMIVGQRGSSEARDAKRSWHGKIAPP